MNQAQTSERWDGTADDIQKRLETLLTPGNRFIDQFQILPAGIYSQIHTCFVISHVIPQDTEAKQQEKVKP